MNVEPGQCWACDEHVLLVLRQRHSPRVELFDCLVLHDDGGAWSPGALVLLSAASVRCGSRRLG